MLFILRLLIILIIIGFVVHWVRKSIPFLTTSKTQAPKPISLVRCHYCNMHIAIDEALSHQGHYYCNQDHQLKAENK